MLRPIALTSGILVVLAGWAGPAQAEPRISYSRHTVKVNLRDLPLSRDARQRALEARIADAAEKVCGGHPDRGNRYTQEELKRMLPAYDKCRADAMQRAQASLNVPVLLAQSAGQ